MKLNVHVIRTNPNHIEELEIEDVASFTVDDTTLLLTYNTGETEALPLRDNSGQTPAEWSGFTVFATRIGLKINMEK